MAGRSGRKGVKNEELQLQCEWSECRKIFTDLCDFYDHLTNHYSENFNCKDLQSTTEDTFTCKWTECAFITNSREDLLRHLYFHGYHTKAKWWGLLCMNKENLKECRAMRNRNIIPELPDGFRCEWANCFMVFDCPDQFYMHVYNHAVFSDEETINGDSKGFVCHWEGCNYSYEKRNNNKSCVGRFKLKEHLRSHSKERSYACPWCGNLYVNRTKFTDHLDRQIDIESHCFRCTHCSRTFPTERLLKDHMRQHVNHYKCPKCAMTCPNPSGLKHHMRYKHSDERPYSCQFCEYKSKTSYDLRVHMTFHQSDLSYRCHVVGCDYAVRSLQNLRHHFRTKHMIGKGKCYACHLCPKSYGVGFQLTNHLRKTHNFQWPPGHSRFKYKECEDGFCRLQTFRFESVELTEELMDHDQSAVDKEEAKYGNAKKRPTKVFPGKIKKNPINRTSTITTRSATLLLQKAQNQRLRKSKPSTSVSKLRKKRVTHVKTTSSEPVSQTLLDPQPSTSSIETDLPETVENTNEATIEPPTFTDLVNVVPKNNEVNDSLVMVDGVAAKDENGKLVSVVVDGETYYLVQGKVQDSTAAVTYCLVNASTYTASHIQDKTEVATSNC